MYRNKSAVSLRTLAHSLKQSITMERNKAHSREFRPLRNSASTINLMNGKDGNRNLREFKNIEDNYLIMLETRKSNRLVELNGGNRESNYSEVRYDIKATKQLIAQRNQKLKEMARTQSLHRFPLPQPQAALLQPLSQNDSLTCTLNILQEQQNRLKQIIEQNYSSANLKASNKHLIESQTLGKELKQISLKYHQFLEYKQELQNRLGFLEEEILATEINFRDQVNQKENCEYFLEQYQNQNHFREEAHHVIKLIQLQYQTSHHIQSQIIHLQQKLSKLEADFKQWKVQQNFELKQKRFQNKLKEHRIQLMEIQNHLDSITQELITKFDSQNVLENSIRKIREYICSYFKKYNQLNLNHIFHNQIDDGMDIFLCKQGLIKQFTQFVNQKTQKIRLVNSLYSLKLNQYCDCLKKIQQLFHLQKTELNKIIALKFEEEIISTKQHIQSLKTQRGKNLTEIQSMQQTIDKILAQENLSIIELMSKKGSNQFCTNKQDGFFNINQIKTKIKEIKIQQNKRISLVNQIFLRLKKISDNQFKFMQENTANFQNFAKHKQSLKKDIEIWQKKVEEITIIKQGYEYKKIKCDKFIDEAVNNMKEKDEIEQQLKSIQKEISQLKKKKIQSITKKHKKKNNHEGSMNFEEVKFQIKPFSSVTNLNDRLKSPWCIKLDSSKNMTKLKLQTYKVSENYTENKKEQDVSAKFRVQKNLQAVKFRSSVIDEEKMSTKTQSSPKNVNERLSLGALNSILLSKCNLVNYRNVEINPKSIKKQASSFGLKILNKENQKQSDELLLQSKVNSIKNSKNQNISRKTSMSKKPQRSTLKKNDSNVETAKKLSLSTTNRKASLKKIQAQSKQSPYTMGCKTKSSAKELNQLIAKKLLRQ